MGFVYISHCSQDRHRAVQIRESLIQGGHADVRIDAPVNGDHVSDPSLEAAIVLVSKDWLAVAACQRDLQRLSDRGAALIPVLATSSPPPLPRELQDAPVVDWTAPGRAGAGADALQDALRQVGGGPDSFPWPPDHEVDPAPYRGLKPLGQRDAGIYFGRDTDIVAGLDALRRLRRAGGPKVFAVVGRSGAGKRSFIGAGLLARLAHNDRFRVLPSVAGPDDAGVDEAFASALGVGPSATDTELQDALLAHAAAAPGGRPRTLVLPVAQAGARLLDAGDATDDWLRRCWTQYADLVVIVAVRDDLSVVLDRFDRCPEVDVFTFRLPGLQPSAVQEAVVGPGRRARPVVDFDPTLTDALLEDLAAPDGLPLVAFALERLARSAVPGETLALAEYQRSIGGLPSGINGAVAAAYERALRDPRCPTNRTALDLLARRVLIPHLVSIEDLDAGPRTHRRAVSALPEGGPALIKHLVKEGLMTASTIDDVEHVAIAHDVVLRHWWGLAGWIREERNELERLQHLLRMAEAWDIDDRSRALLLHRGAELAYAEKMLERPDFAARSGDVTRAYLQACRSSEQQKTETAARWRRRRRYARRFVNLVATLVILAAVGVLGIAVLSARHEGRMRSAQRASESRIALEAGQGERAQRLAILAAKDTALSPASHFARLQHAAATFSSRRPAVLPGAVVGALSPNGERVVTIDAAGGLAAWHRDGAYRWVAESGATRPDTPGPVLAAAVSDDGRTAVAALSDGAVHVANDGAWSRLSADGADRHALVAVAGDGSAIVTASRWGGNVRYWTRSEDAWSSVEIPRAHRTKAALSALGVSADGRWVVGGDRAGRIWWWSAEARGQISEACCQRGGVGAVVALPGGFPLAGGVDGTVVRWTKARGARGRNRLVGLEGAVVAVARTADGKTVAAATDEGQLWIGRVDGRAGQRFDAHRAAVGGLRFSPEGERLVSVARDGSVRVYGRGGAGRWSGVFWGGAGMPARSASWSADGARLLTVADDAARVWTVAGGMAFESATTPHRPRVGGFAGPTQSQGTAAVDPSPSSTRRSSNASTTGASIRPPVALEGHERPVVDVAISADGTAIVTCDVDGAVRWTRDGAPPMGLVDDASVMRLAPTGERIAVVTETGPKVLQLAEGRVLSEDIAVPKARDFRWSADGQALLVISDGGSPVWSWRVGGTAEPVELGTPLGAVVDARISSDGLRMAVITGDRLSLGDRTAPEPVQAATFTSGGAVVAAVAGPLRWYPADAAQTPMTIASVGGAVAPAAMSVCGSAVTVGAADGTVGVVRTEDGRWTMDTVAHLAQGIRATGCFAEGNGVWALDAGGVARMFRRSSDGRWAAAQVPETAPVVAVAVSADGRRTVTAVEGRAFALAWDTSILDVEARPADYGGAAQCPGWMTAAPLSSGDLDAVPGLAQAGLRAGDDVCALAADPLDDLLTGLLPRKAWAFVESVAPAFGAGR